MNMTQNPQRQKGAVLLIGLLTLVVLTIIGLHASRSSTMGLIAATNAQESAAALAAAEDSVAYGERQTWTLFRGHHPGDLDDDSTDGYYDEGDIDLNVLDWTDPTGIQRIFDNNNVLIAEFVVEYLGEGEAPGDSLTLGSASNKNQLYRISGHGVGARGTARIVQTIFAASE